MSALDMAALLREVLAERAGAPPAPPAAARARAAPPPVLSAAPACAAACAGHALLLARAPAPLPPPALGAVCYAPDAVSRAHEAALLAAVGAAPWVALRARRVQQWGGAPGAGGLARAAPLPPFLADLAAALVAAGVFSARAPPNHALVNHYAPGEGIDAHTDGPCYAPVVATLSLGDDALMRFRARAPPGAPRGELLLRARSLVVTSGEAYADWAHEIERAPARAGERAPLWNADEAAAAPGEEVPRAGTRVSITLRHALEGGGGE